MRISMPNSILMGISFKEDTLGLLKLFKFLLCRFFVKRQYLPVPLLFGFFVVLIYQWYR